MNPIKELSLPNYAAVAILQQLGMLAPSQKQITIMESVISMMTNPQQIEPETIRLCVGNNKLAYYFLFVKINEYCKLIRSEQVFLLDLDLEDELVEEEEPA
jgi:hypothetical protein